MLFSIKQEFKIRSGIRVVAHSMFEDFETDEYEAFLVFQRQVSKLRDKECKEYLDCLDREVKKREKTKNRDVSTNSTCLVYGRDAYLVYRGLTNGLNIKFTKKGLIYEGLLVTGDDYNKNIMDVEKKKLQEFITFFGEDEKELPSIN